jgi:putative mRNA 3-end processing factor
MVSAGPSKSIRNHYGGLIDVLGSGAVLLGPNVTCDGFHQDRNVRVQTHIHTDHMGDFSTSKSGEIVMSQGVKDLLRSSNPDFDFRPNINVLKPGATRVFGKSTVSLLPAGHMLGASQVLVELADGSRLAYSGDFSWPLDYSITCNALVVDATYGTPSSDRAYNQIEAEERLVELVKNQLKSRPVHLLANSAVMERALLAISISDVAKDVPILGNDKLCTSVDVHRNHGWPIDKLTSTEHEEGHKILTGRNYIRCWQLAEGGRIDGIVEGAKISLTKYRARNVVETFGDNGYKVGMSNHADFEGTLSYIQSTKAEFVVTDACRVQPDRARELATAIKQELGIEAIASSNKVTHKWGPNNN